MVSFDLYIERTFNKMVNVYLYVTVIEQFILGIMRYSDGWKRDRASERFSAHQNIT